MLCRPCHVSSEVPCLTLCECTSFITNELPWSILYTWKRASFITHKVPWLMLYTWKREFYYKCLSNYVHMKVHKFHSKWANLDESWYNNWKNWSKTESWSWMSLVTPSRSRLIIDSTSVPESPIYIKNCEHNNEITRFKGPGARQRGYFGKMKRKKK